ncbi:GNAT family N-acetyltransferase [Acrocarpospora phusangensis]|uniref:GNAT family N-acetyltransferase n=1 Tax=Acrocarpospora phusangensis TaxID=1070424 RepID=UPI00194E9E0F|nr:GNAT family N-acetyltransferase [Acrocarpospora phusangensis]
MRKIATRFGLLSTWCGTPDFLDAERFFGRLLLASDDAGAELGFGGTLRRGSLTHLGDLFVLPERQSSGVGRALLTDLLGHDEPRMTFASSDPRAVALYVRHGLFPWTPLLYLKGPTAGLPKREVRPAGADDITALDAEASGGARHATLAWYAGLPGVAIYATDGGYAALRRTDDEVTVGPAGGNTPQECANAVLGALAVSPARNARIAVPGTHPLVGILLAAGWRIADMDTLMGDDASRGLVHPDRYIPNPDIG